MRVIVTFKSKIAISTVPVVLVVHKAYYSFLCCEAAEILSMILRNSGKVENIRVCMEIYKLF